FCPFCFELGCRFLLRPGLFLRSRMWRLWLTDSLSGGAPCDSGRFRHGCQSLPVIEPAYQIIDHKVAHCLACMHGGRPYMRQRASIFYLQEAFWDMRLPSEDIEACGEDRSVGKRLCQRLL